MSDRRLMLVDRKKNPNKQKQKTKPKKQSKKSNNNNSKTPPENPMTIYHKAGTDSTNSTV